jgi:hypothetical protein
MSVGLSLFLVAVFGAAFVLLALADRRTLVARTAYALVAGVLTFALGLLAASLGFDHGPTGGRMVIERTVSAVEIEVAARSAARGFGGWLAVLAAGELLRLVLKRTAGTEVLAPAVLFLAGAILIDPQWGLGVAFAVALACLTAMSVWGRPAAAAGPRIPPGGSPTAATPEPGELPKERQVLEPDG